MTGKVFLFATSLICIMLIGCSGPVNSSEGDKTDDSTVLKFDISNSKALFAGPASATTVKAIGRGDAGNIVLLKETLDGGIEKAVSGEHGQFIISNMITNPITNDVFLLGYFSDSLSNYQIIRVDSNSDYYGLNADSYHYYWNSNFDSSGAFYFTTSSSTPGQPCHVWKYIDKTATSIAESAKLITIKKVMNNGYIIYTIQDGGTWLRAPDGGLTAWDRATSGIYSSFSNAFYYGTKGFRFDTMTEFESTATNVGSGNDFDAISGTFIVVEKTAITKYAVQGDKTLSETKILETYVLDYKTIDYYGDEIFAKCSGSYIYFAGKDPTNIRNVYRVNESGVVEKLLTGSDDNGYMILNASFDGLGKVTAAVQKLADGRYGTIEGDFSTGLYTFSERSGFSQITDVLIK